MSLLEQLAKKRAAKNLASSNNNSSISANNADGEDTNNKLISRLSQLRKNYKASSNEQSSNSTLQPSHSSAPTLLQRMKARQNTREASPDPYVPSSLPTTSSPSSASSSTSSLSLKLSVLRKNAQHNQHASSSSNEGIIKKPISNENKIAKTNKDKVMKENKSLKQQDLWNTINKIQKNLLISTANNQTELNLSPSEQYQHITKLLLSDAKQKGNNGIHLEKEYQKLFTVYYPTKVMENHTQPILNFQNPSPDDIIINAQLKAFGEMEKNVSNLKINAKEEDEPPSEFSKSFYKPTLPTSPLNIQTYISENLNIKNPFLNVILLGHSKSGKSTILGRLLKDLKLLSIEEIRSTKFQLERQQEKNPNSLYLAKIGETKLSKDKHYRQIKHENDTFNIFDIPIFRQSRKNNNFQSLIATINQCSVAILTIDCNTDQFESNFNIDGELIQLIYLLKFSARKLNKIVILLNKMDSIDWYHDRFIEIKTELSLFFKDLNLCDDPDNEIVWIPTSGLYGQGIVDRNAGRRSKEWWSNEPTLFGKLKQWTLPETSRTIEIETKKILNSPFIFHIENASKINSRSEKLKQDECFVTGHVHSGSIQIGESMTIFPSKISVTIESITCLDTLTRQSQGKSGRKSKIAVADDYVILRVSKLFDFQNDVNVGDFATSIEFSLENLCQISSTFQVRLTIFPNIEKERLAIGSSFVLIRGNGGENSTYKVRVSKILSLSSNTYQNTTIGFDVELESESPIPMISVKDNGSDFTCFNEFILEQNERIYGLGSFILR
ncbi:Ski7p NDAI_0F00440 [Naumovozyma dairenensis CBS 421]|uniref:Tr-type G domain-containing protein n=1 Tax=Naumovozyma dairenensis (strain ATCC 10597 / BCRC 20456 / CBS 421 / NBRC 0211 / NRRL Y-12639) TaxID=1071378 RepID=G0WC52_NAUDC|nr:hypothetical protein NDAI_0F00440 [Naumovozyma dairenensis CBS 421]CCD25363.1 hypothetical protein NDAI_0F00440 [Naumovozyma dairenensis CBS 421]